MSLRTASTRLLNTYMDGVSSTSLGSLSQCLTTFSMIKFFLIFSVNLPWHKLRSDLATAFNTTSVEMSWVFYKWGGGELESKQILSSPFVSAFDLFPDLSPELHLPLQEYLSMGSDSLHPAWAMLDAWDLPQPPPASSGHWLIAAPCQEGANILRKPFRVGRWQREVLEWCRRQMQFAHSGASGGQACCQH